MRSWIMLAVLETVIIGCSKNDQSQSKSSATESNSTEEAKSAAKTTAKTESRTVAISASPKPLIIDVRTQEEWDAGHLDAAVLIPLAVIAERIGEVAPDKTHKIHLHCRSGGRSGQAKTILEGLGYNNVENVGGFDDAKQRFQPE